MRLLILGLSATGKTTLATTLRTITNAPVIDVDDAVRAITGGSWPADMDTLDALFESVNRDVIGLPRAIYLTSWLTAAQIREFATTGWTLIELHAEVHERINRRIARGDSMNEAIRDRILRHHAMLDTVVLETHNLFTKMFDVTKMTTQELVAKLQPYLVD
ncbi:MAG: hypothetical protein AAB384_03940 [Patescibacteria group bacterium]